MPVASHLSYMDSSHLFLLSSNIPTLFPFNFIEWKTVQKKYPETQVKSSYGRLCSSCLFSVPFHRNSPACPVFQLGCSLLCLRLWIVEQFQLPAVPPALCARPPCSSCKTWHELHLRDTVPQTAELDRLSSVLSSCSQITRLSICPIVSPRALQYKHEVLENFSSSAPQNSLTLCVWHTKDGW